MKIELKKTYYSKELSEETNAFKASLYINGIHVGIAENAGHGGPTNYTPVNEKGRVLIKEAEAFCKNLPPEKYTVDGVEHQLGMDLELYINTLLYDYLMKKDLQQFRKEIKRMSKTQIVIGIPDQYYRTMNIKLPISGILDDPTRKSLLIAILKQNILPHMEEGEKVLNANIPIEVLTSAGLKANQYVQQNSSQNTQKKAPNKGRKI